MEAVCIIVKERFVSAVTEPVLAGGGSRVYSSPGEMCNIGLVPLLRLERLWQEELNEVGPAAASLRRVVWIFCRTRLILSIMCLMITQLAGFSGPVSSNCPF